MILENVTVTETCPLNFHTRSDTQPRWYGWHSLALLFLLGLVSSAEKFKVNTSQRKIVYLIASWHIIISNVKSENMFLIFER